MAEVREPQEEDEIAFVGAVTVAVDRENILDWMGDREEWVEKTKESEMEDVYGLLERRILPEDGRDRQRLLDICHRYTILDGLLYLCEPEGQLRLFVPTEFRKNLVKQRHDGKCAGHMSGKKLYRQLSFEFFWPNMLTDCIRAHLSCRICAHTKNARANEPPLRVVETSEPLELVCLDILDIGPSNSNNKYICVIVDHFTKYVVAEPIPNKSADSIAKVFVEKFVLTFGAPRRIHSDRGTEFLNATMAEIAKILGIERSFTAGHDPQGNGLVERVNRNFEKNNRHFEEVDGQQLDVG